jgi:hypothetical protein
MIAINQPFGKLIFCIFHRPLNGRLVEVDNVGFVDLQFQNLVSAHWPLWTSATGKNGSIGDRLLFRFIAGKLSLNSDS